MDYTKEKKKKKKKNEVTDVGELGGEIITQLKDDKILEEEGVKDGHGDTKTKKKNKRGNSEGKNTDGDAELESENVASSREVVEKGDATCREDYVKVLKKKKDKEGKRERKGEAVERLTVNNDITAKKAERKKKEGKKIGGSGPQLTEHSVEDIGRDTGRIQNVEIVDRGQELDGDLGGEAERKKKKKNKKRTDIGHGSQNSEIVEVGDVLDDCLDEKVGKKTRKTGKKKIEVEVNLGASEDVTELPSNVAQELQNQSTKGFETDWTSDKDDTKKSKKRRTREKEKESNASSSRKELERKDENMDRESALDGEDVDSSRKVVEKGDATCSEDYVKVFKNKKNKKGKRERKDEADEHLVVNNDITDKKDKKRGGLGPQLTEHSMEDVGQATDKIQNVEIVDRGLVEKAERKKKDKKKTGIGYQIPELRVEYASLPSGHELQNTEIVETGDVLDDCLVEKVGKKKRKREKKKIEVEVNLGASEDVTELPSNVTQELQNTSTEGFETSDKDITKKSKKKQRTREKEKESNASGSHQVNADSAENEKGNVRKRKKPDSVAKGDQDAKSVKPKKTVKFSDQVEVFPLSDNEEKLVQGKRFSHEEDEILKKAVHDYIEAHCWGDEGLNMVLNCRKHREARNCWKEIALALPHRPKTAVYYRAQTLFRRSESTKWTKEDYEQIKEFQKKHGNQWKILAQDLKKHRVHVKDTWRRIRLSNAKKGHWNQEEYQSLFDLVNLDLKTRFKEEKKSKHGMLRDNICWTAISDKLTTRTHAICCQKWYDQLTSSLVAEGEWSDVDDYRLINALYELDASCIDDVDWDNLLEHRDGDVCKKRWNQMVLHIGSHKTQTFGEQVEVLAKRYCPDLIEVREEWDNKPYADLVTNKVQADPESA